MEDTVIPRSHKESDRVLCAAVSWSSQHRIPRTCKIDKKKSLKAEVEEKCCSELGESLRRKNIKTKNRCHIYELLHTINLKCPFLSLNLHWLDFQKMPPPASASRFHRASAWNIHFGFPIDLKVEGFWCSFDVKWTSAFSTFLTQLFESLCKGSSQKKNFSSKKCSIIT